MTESKLFNTPILFLIFNRPEETKKVFEEIKKIKPANLYISADGPRASKYGEDLLCDKCRQVVLDGIDWHCEIKTLFRKENLGCGKAVSEAITWFFDNVDEGIILEDDCLPDPSFFIFCETMLAKYRYDDRIMHIGASNFQLGKWHGEGDYYYSRYSHIWGWASWKSAWKKYDFKIKEWENIQSKNNLNIIFETEKNQYNYWANIFNIVVKGEIDTWDYQWQFAIWNNYGMGILPNKNLVINIGFGVNATHTIDENKFINSISLETLLEYRTPGYYNNEADCFTFHNIFHNTNSEKLNIYQAVKKSLLKIYWLFKKCSSIFKLKS